MNRKHKVVTTDEQIASALVRAAEFEPDDRLVTKATYGQKDDVIRLFLSNGASVSIPRRWLQGLEKANAEQLSEIHLRGNGTGLHWPQLDVDHYVLGLLNHVFGTRQWMAHLGRRGGASTSGAKATAARANGRKGGRPRKHSPGVAKGAAKGAD